MSRRAGEFLTEVQAGAYGRFAGGVVADVAGALLFLDDSDLSIVGRRRGDHKRLGFAVQLATVRFVGAFLADLGDVPGEVVEYVAGQLDVAAASMATYMQREKTRLEHQWEIAREVGYRDFADADADAEAELAVWVDDRAWTTGEGPVAVFNGAVGWLRERPSADGSREHRSASTPQAATVPCRASTASTAPAECVRDTQSST